MLSALLKNGDRHQFRSRKFVIVGADLTRNRVAGLIFQHLLRTGFAAVALCVCASAQGVSMGHVHFNTGDPQAHRKFWTLLGANPASPIGSNDVYSVQNAFILVRKQEPSGPMAGSIIPHIGFRVFDLGNTLTRCRAEGYKVLTPSEVTMKTHKANVLGPDDVNIELLADTSLRVPVAVHHIHFYNSPVDSTRGWYVRTFGAAAGKREIFEAADLPGINLSFSPSETKPAGTKGRVLDHIGFSVKGLQGFCKKLELQGIHFDLPYTVRPDLGLAIAFITDPWGAYIELTEPIGQ
jgi:extradiol dioxygenase family protein